MRFAVFKSDLDMRPFSHARGRRFSLDASTSVAQQKGHLLETLKELGEVVPVDDAVALKDYKALCREPGTILTTIHQAVPYAGVPRRLLLHSLGDFLLTHVYFDPEHFADNTHNLVTSRLQAKRLREHLREAAPALGVFTPRLNQRNFRPPSAREKLAARTKLGLSPRCRHVVYAGRWLANKGLCQLVRALDLWPLPGLRITLAGNYEPGFVISQTGANHHGFAAYFEREILRRGRGSRLKLLRAHGPEALRELLWSADAFVYPSIHEDENFGMAPREAALCGAPVVVSDFCGLGELGRGPDFGLLETYPTLAGPRYSLRRLRDLVVSALRTPERRLEENIRFVLDECSPARAKADLKRGAESLLRRPLAPVLPRPRALRRLQARLLRCADAGFLQAILEKRAPLPEGLLVEGTGVTNKEYAHHRLLSAIQGFYTTTDRPHQVVPGGALRGFFRLALWREEKALAELGYPGPRVKRYPESDWRELSACIEAQAGQEIVLRPRTPGQVRLAQELVELGYLVPD